MSKTPKQSLFTPEEMKKLSSCKNNEELIAVLQDLKDSPELKNLPPLPPDEEAFLREFARIILDRAYEETEKYQKEKAEGKNPKLPWEVEE
jgi:hypothetical protein